MVIVAEAGDGRKAIEQFRTHRPDITRMALQMSIVNGSEAISPFARIFPTPASLC